MEKDQRIKELYDAVEKYCVIFEYAVEGFVRGPGTDGDYSPQDMREAWKDFESGLVDKTPVERCNQYTTEFRGILKQLADENIIRERDKEDARRVFRSLLDYPCAPENYQKWYISVIRTLRNIFNKNENQEQDNFVKSLALVDLLREGHLLTDGAFVYFMSTTKCANGKDLSVVHAYSRNDLNGSPVRIVPYFEWRSEIEDAADNFEEYNGLMDASGAAAKLRDGEAVIDDKGIVHFASVVVDPAVTPHRLVFFLNDHGKPELECCLDNFEDERRALKFSVYEDSKQD